MFFKNPEPSTVTAEPYDFFLPLEALKIKKDMLPNDLFLPWVGTLCKRVFWSRL